MNNSQEEYIKRIEKVVHFMEENLTEDLDLKTLSSKACFSQFHFHRIFKSIMKETPVDYVNRLRVEKAASALTHLPDVKISEIAYRLGFSSPTSFTRSFKKHFGLSPSEFKIHRAEQTTVNNTEVGKPASILSQKLSGYNESNHQIKNLEIKTLKPIKVIYMPCLKGYKLEEIRKVWKKLSKWADFNSYIDIDINMYGIPWDDPTITDIDKCRYYACLTVKEGVNFPDEIQRMVIQGGLYVVYTFEGTLQESEKVYNWLFGEWLPQSGYLPVDAPEYEQYFKDPDEEPKGIFRTKINIPISPIK
jgi:AraC family transcriptional regulator